MINNLQLLGDVNNLALDIKNFERYFSQEINSANSKHKCLFAEQKTINTKSLS